VGEVTSKSMNINKIGKQTQEKETNLCQTSLLHDSIDRKVCKLRLTPCKALKSSTLSHNLV
jgi:hypothetical protein